MKNFIFKSSEEDSGLIKNLFNKLDMILSEQRHNRTDISLVLSMLSKLLVNKNLQKQVDDYFENEDSEHIPEEKQE